MDNVSLDDDRTLLQRIFRSLPRSSRLERLSSFLLYAKGMDCRTVVCAAEWMYEEVMKFRETAGKKLAAEILYSIVIGYMRFSYINKERKSPEDIAQKDLAERYLKIAELSADALFDYYYLRQIKSVCRIIECLPNKRQKALDYAKKYFGEEGVRYILYRFRLLNVILASNGSVTHRLERKVAFNPNPDVSYMAAKWLVENAKIGKTFDIVIRYAPELTSEADQRFEKLLNEKDSFIVRVAKKVARRVARRIKSQPSG